MRIECTTTFMHGTDRFERGDVRTVSDADGAYFIQNGWAALPGEAAPAPFVGDVAIAEIHSTAHETGSVING